MLNKIQKNNSALSDKLAGKKEFWLKGPSDIILYRKLMEVLPKFCKGKVLDVGAGRLAYKKLLLKYSTEYRSVDFIKTNPDLDFVADSQDMKAVIGDNSFDTVFCSQVLEHVPEPQRAVDEMHRILKPGGAAIITVPFLGYLHNEPYDFFRYTKYALAKMAKKSGFEVVLLSEVGGLFCFLGYIWSTIFLGFFGILPFVGRLFFYLNVGMNYFWILLDRITKNEKILPLDYLIIIKKH